MLTEGRTPTGVKVAPTSHANLEKIAKVFFPMLPKERGHPYRISGWRVLEKTLPKARFQYRIHPDADMNGCAAFAIPDKRLVVIGQRVYDGLFDGSPYSRSTVIHEFSHIAQQHHITLHRGAVLRQHKFYEDSEWQANALTAAIMMPIEICRKVKNAYDLAEECGTSVEAATYRLEKLQKRGLLT
jgi:hypothetical protein